MKKINTALLSFGMSGTVFHAPFLTTVPGFNFYGVWERTKNIASEKYPQVKTFRSLEDLLEDDAIELVIVNTPSVTHFDYTKKALLAGKHVVVEKPFTSTVEEADELIALAKEKNLVLSVFHNRRYDSDFRTIKKVLDEKLLGDIVDAEFHYDRYTPELSYKTHKETPTPGVGCIYDLGSHLIDQALQLFGNPNAVFADIAINRPNSQVDDYIDIILFYSTSRVSLKSSYYVREPLAAYQIHGKLGSFIKSKGDVQEVMLQAGHLPEGEDWGKEPSHEDGLLHTEINGKVVKEKIPTLAGNYGDYYSAIFESVVNGAPLPVTAEQGRDVISIIEASLLSNKERKVINVI
jgi:scyllo-inositol 2-dehydrogenase (NADP+)